MALALAVATTWMGESIAMATERDPAAAQTLFEQAFKDFEAGNIDAACTKFEESMRLDPANGTLINVARCHERQGKIATAWAEFDSARTLSERAGQTDRANVAKAAAERLAPTLPKLRIDVSEGSRDLDVRRDGVTLARASFGVVLPIDPGVHRISVRAPGKMPFDITVEIPNEPETKVVEVPVLADAPQATSPSGSASDGNGSRPLLGAGAIAMGAGGAFIIGGAVLGVISLNKVSDAENDPHLCPQRQCYAAGRKEIDDAVAMGNAATALLVVGGAAFAAGTIMLTIDLTTNDSPDEAEHAVMAPWFGPEGGGLSIGGRF
jgi:hypothetical protein